ncbi:MAG: peptide chain release factor N(5)-glutamine methyltransferase, partial [Coriobacteriia bacterium]
MATERIWNCKDALSWTAEYLERKGDDHPRRSAEWLLGAATGLSRVEIYAHHDRPLTPEERSALRVLIERRAAGEPLQYVTGEMPFRHLVIRVEPGVFIPRPETEVLVDAALEAIEGLERPLVGEVCTGSGCVAVSIAYENPKAHVWTSDISEAAVEAARRNALYAGVADRVQVSYGDLFAPYVSELPGSLDLVVANPPYIPSTQLPELPSEVLGFEPHTALDGGPDGLHVARRIARDAHGLLAEGGTLAVELAED